MSATVTAPRATATAARTTTAPRAAPFANATATAEEGDAHRMGVTLLNASDVAACAVTCFLLALTTMEFTKLTRSPVAGHAVAASLLALGAAASLCVTTRLFKAHYGVSAPS